jgi:hypothetical protein
VPDGKFRRVQKVVDYGDRKSDNLAIVRLGWALCFAQVHYSNSNLKMSLNLPSNVNAVR